MRTAAALTTLFCLALAAPVTAHTIDPNGPCDVPAEDAVAVGPLYVSLASPLLWSESNARAGLQTHSHTCTDENGRTVTVGADTKLL